MFTDERRVAVGMDIRTALVRGGRDDQVTAPGSHLQEIGENSAVFSNMFHYVNAKDQVITLHAAPGNKVSLNGVHPCCKFGPAEEFVAVCHLFALNISRGDLPRSEMR